MRADRNHKTLLRLLSGKDRLSGAEKEAILADVLAAVEQGAARPGGRERARARRRPGWGIAVASAGAVAAAAIALVLLPRSPDRAPGTFTARGRETDPTAVAAGFEVRCPGAAAAGRCRAGDKLLFEVSAGGRARFFAALARRGDTTIWYFPSLGRRSLDLAEHAPRGVLDAGIVLGPEHVPGRYEIVGLFSSRPLSRDEARAAAAGVSPDSAGETIRVGRELVVE